MRGLAQREWMDILIMVLLSAWIIMSSARWYIYIIVTFSFLIYGFFGSWSFAQFNLNPCGTASAQTYTSLSSINFANLCKLSPSWIYPVSTLNNSTPNQCVSQSPQMTTINQITIVWNTLSWVCEVQLPTLCTNPTTSYMWASCSATYNPIGVCGPASTGYSFTNQSYTTPLCTVGTASPMNPSFPVPWASVSRICNSAWWASPTCTATRASQINNGVCGPAEHTYLDTDSTFIGALCSVGTESPLSPTFPSPGMSASWDCISPNGWSPDTCTIYRNPPATISNGSCGININSGQSYAYTATNRLGTNQVSFCAWGNIAWHSSLWTLAASFPWSWANINRNCEWVGSWSTSVWCTATRELSSPVGICGPTILGASFSSLTGGSSWLCLDSTVSGFITQSMNTTLYTARYDRSCFGTDVLQAPVACYAYQSPTPIAGMCNPWYNGQSVSYAQIQNATLCTQAGNTPILSAIPNNGTQWTWTCQWVGWAPSASCSANAVTDGLCTPYTTPQTQAPTNLCLLGVPTAVAINGGSYRWTCNGTNGGVASNLCSASCLNGQCTTVTTTTGTTTNNTTWTIITGMNGQTTPISLNQQCSDPDGCSCYNVTIVNGSICLPNTLTGVTDSIRTAIDVGQVCTDADGCICHGSNAILNGTICQTDGLIGMLPWSADLVISQAVSSGTIGRRSTLDMTLTYYNLGPNIATGARVEYYLSPLIKSIRTSAPYSIVQNSSSGYIETNEYQNNILVFPIGDIPTGENGQITISMVLNAKLTDKEVVNATSIASRVRDPRPLNNAQKIILWLDDQTSSVLGVYLVNPFIGIQTILSQYNSMNKRLRIDPVFQDVQRWDDNYMHIMTAVRNGIFEWYKFTYSRQMLPGNCTSRIEAINVIARMMYAAGSRDVYTTRQNGTAYVDLAGITRESQNFVNRAHERWLLRLLQPKQIRWSYYLEPNNNISQGKIKEMFYLIYQRYGFDPSVMNGLLTEEESCVTRGDLAYLVAHVMRNNPNIMMGYNDEFLAAVVAKTTNLSIANRRIQIQRMIDKLQTTDPSILFANGYDGESLVGILESAMAGRPYNPVVDVSSTSNFLYQKR